MKFRIFMSIFILILAALFAGFVFANDNTDQTVSMSAEIPGDSVSVETGGDPVFAGVGSDVFGITSLYFKTIQACTDSAGKYIKLKNDTEHKFNITSCAIVPKRIYGFT